MARQSLGTCATVSSKVTDWLEPAALLAPAFVMEKESKGRENSSALTRTSETESLNADWSLQSVILCDLGLFNFVDLSALCGYGFRSLLSALQNFSLNVKWMNFLT